MASENFTAAAFPVHADTISRLGLTKRELIAAMAMQGLISLQDKGIEAESFEDAYKQMAMHSLMAADALLIELEK